jgi:integrase
MQCKNAAAYRLVLLADAEGRHAMKMLKRLVGSRLQDPSALVFHSNHKTPLRESNVLREALHPVLEALGPRIGGMHGFRHGCNRRWELAGMNPAVLRQMMGHSSAAMTARYTGEIPIESIRADFSRRIGPKIVVMENKENAQVA